ncbi:hypothetical protein RHSIM_Rhsim05G0192100 [Rhododendron simsii]|uniref:Uncharacterized protein n=1 Tax=Rhododendron simsii TaxID=118357 RepID=A0A834LL97_RHOSS|nr:hypothetical protein RHSIM_Rhsim05G0192100 [Rhododendron simsii]
MVGGRLSSLKFDSSSYVDPEGLSGGLALWWNNDLEIDVEFASRNLMHVIVTDKAIPACWATSFDMVALQGDFNQVARVEDKIGGNLPSQNSLASFNDMLSECGLVDLEFKGPKFTWRNNRSGEDFIMERIDMAFANSEWRELREQAMRSGSGVRNQEGEEALMKSVCTKLRGCKEKLKEWNFRKFGNLKLKIAATKDQLLEIQEHLGNGFHPNLAVMEKELI